VTIKLKGGLPSLRRGEALDVVRAAIGRVNQGDHVRIVEYSIQSNHVHMLVEASNSADLSKGMASLNTGLGMRLNRTWGRVGQGSVFKERFHMVVISTPRQMRNALRYVLRNDVHHKLNLRTLDPCSSAPSFNGWQQLQGSTRQRAAAANCVSAKPQTWLLRVGWQKTNGQRRLLSTAARPTLALEA
jgi:REP element-mobilizing transposase RayT